MTLPGSLEGRAGGRGAQDKGKVADGLLAVPVSSLQK